MQQPGASIAQESAGFRRIELRIKRVDVPKRIPEKECIDRLNAMKGRKFVMWLGEYAGTNKTRAVMVCDHGHEWNAVASSLLRGSGCIKCSGKGKYSEDERINHINSTGDVRFVRWVDGYKNSYSKAVVVCSRGHEFKSTINGLVNSGKGCARCAGNYSFSAEERILQINKLENIEFVDFDGEYKNCDSKAIVRCLVDGCEWSATVDSLINSGRGCPDCAYVSRANAGRTPKEDREAQLNSLPGVKFVRWDNGYKNAHGKAVMMCDCGHEWSASVDSLVNAGRGCPSCAQSGFSPSKPGTLYLLRSECGHHVKVGISNKPEQRIKQLNKSTPFGFIVIDTHSDESGKAILDLENYFHKKYESSGFTGFDGATEWLRFTPELLEEFRKLGVNHDNRKSKSS